MGSRVSPQELLVAIAAAGYFTSPDTKQHVFVRVVERELNVSVDFAIAMLKESGFATFSYASSAGLEPRDVVDNWSITLTSSGKSALAGKL